MDAATASASQGLAADPRALAALRRQAHAGDKSALQGAARQFEALFLDLLMRRMRATAPGQTVMDNEGTRMFQELHDQQMSRQIAAHGGIGLAATLVRQLGGPQHAALPPGGAGAALQKPARQPLSIKA